MDPIAGAILGEAAKLGMQQLFILMSAKGMTPEQILAAITEEYAKFQANKPEFLKDV